MSEPMGEARVPEAQTGLRKMDAAAAIGNQLKVNIAERLTTVLEATTGHDLDENSAKFVVGDGSNKDEPDTSRDPHCRFVATLNGVGGDSIRLDVSSVADIQGNDTASGRPISDVVQERVTGERTEEPIEVVLEDGTHILAFNLPRYQERPDDNEQYEAYAVKLGYTPSNDTRDAETIRELQASAARAAREDLTDYLQETADYNAMQAGYKATLEAAGI